ncbi:polysaccharide deacetylase [Paenibacillus filicis]|uniref:Polysaccharide deacetylase n=1 Tax=Paenibacillus gyeongsangnamensis TaxID=3388067 RepID=A0ABT4QK30_9BACL|nr:polysaccharide deacetylase family protein [Paenibacillus filicis]MCZ8517199.1 polysaccharide deacetylase [Paenibacillus filicis]
MDNDDQFLFGKRVRPSHKVAYLTFDDGPNEVTLALLNILARHRAKASFFMLEPHIRRYPCTVRAMIRQGHAVGLHGVTHKVNRFYASKRSVVRELDQTRRTLKRATGKTSYLVRTPYESLPHLKPAYFKALKKAGYRLWDWNVDSKDWKYKNRYSIVMVKKGTLRMEKAMVRPVILMHDLKETAEILPKILLFLKRRGFRFKKITPDLKPVHFVK